MIFAEIGLNHKGNLSYANRYIKFIKNNDIDGVTIQVREKNFYLNSKRKNLKLPFSFYKEFYKLKSKHKKK